MSKNGRMGKKAFLEKLGKHIRETCRAKGFSQDRIYLEGGFSRGTLSKIENGKVSAKIYTLKRIADVIGVSLSDLVNFK